MLGDSLIKQMADTAPHKSRPYVRLFIYILATSLILYSQFIFGDKVLSYGTGDWGYDTFHQYVPVYEFFANAIRSGTLSDYSLQYGVGTSVFGLLVTRISDPFSMINVLFGVVFGSQYIADCVVYVQILKILCAGLLTLFYLKQFGFSERSSMISAYIYAFSGYMMTAGQHYYFSTYPVYNILLLIIIEKVIQKQCKIKNCVLMSIVVALVCINGVQPAFITLLGASVYYIFRLIQIYGKDIRNLVLKIGLGIFFVVEGIGISSFCLLPEMEGILDSTRLSSNATIFSRITSSFSLATPQIIKSSFLRLFSNSLEGTVNSWSGGKYHWEMFSCFYTALLIPIATQFLWATFTQGHSLKNKIIRSLPFIVIIFSILSNFIPSLFNVFAYPAYRYVFVLLPLFAIAFADTLDNISKGAMNRFLNYAVTLASCVFIIWGGSSVYNSGNTTVDFPICISIAVVIGGCIILDLMYLSQKIEIESDIKRKIKSTLGVMLSLVIAFNLFSENYITLYFQRYPASKSEQHSNLINNDAVNDIKNIEKDNFYRFETEYQEGRMPDHMYSFTLDVPTTAHYNSNVSSTIVDFYKKMLGDVTDASKAYHGVIYNKLGFCVGYSIAKDLLGVKYFLSTAVIDDEEWEEVKRYEDGLILYKNKSINSIGLLFDNYITEEASYEKSLSDRRLGIGSRLIISNAPNDVNDYATVQIDESKTVKVDEVIAPDSVFVHNGTINKAENLQNGETVVNVSVNNSSITFPVISQTDGQNLYMIKSDNAVSISHLCYMSSKRTWTRIDVEPINSSDETTYVFSIPPSALLIGVVYKGEGITDLSISCQEIDRSYTAQGIQLKCHRSGKEIDGTVSALKNSMLYIPIPYDENWSAYVDNELVEIYKANYLFCAIQMPKGEHTVRLVYNNKVFHVGVILSIVSAIILIVFILLYELVIRRRKSGPGNEITMLSK